MTNMAVRDFNMERNSAYWKKKLENGPAPLSLPLDTCKLSVFENGKEIFPFTVEDRLYHSLKALAEFEKISPALLLVTALRTLLHRYSQEEDICIGITGREGISNILVLRANLPSAISFRDALKEIGKVYHEAIEHEMPFDKLIDELSEQKDNSKTNPLFDVMLHLGEDREVTAAHLENVKESSASTNLILHVFESIDNVRCSFLYNKERFDKQTISRMAGHYYHLLEGAVNYPDTPIAKLPLITEQEKQQLLVDWNKPTVSYPKDTTIDQQFEEQARQTPENIAIILEDTKVTYRELNQRADQIAAYLRKFNITGGKLVAVCLNRSPDMIASFLGVLKAGGAYIPFDLSYPKDRIAYMLEDSQVSFIITTDQYARDLPPSRAQVIYLDNDVQAMDDPVNEFVHISRPDSRAYVIYTSGSTGKPKGVEINHLGVIRLVENAAYANLGPEEIILNRAPIAFDVSIFEIYGALLNGGKLVIMNSPKPTFKDIATAIQKNHVTTLRVGPDILNVLLEDFSETLGSLKQVFSGGEVLPVWLAVKFKSKLSECVLINAYGPTENAVNTTCYHVKEIPDGAASIPIGRPISNDKVYILDPFLQPVPIGVPGELYMTGDGMARGYLHKEKLTNEKFIVNPFNRKKDRKLYKSGDICRYRSDGNIEFLGRADEQVKIRGNRIELGEIETTISLLPGVRHAVAGITHSKSGTKELVVYVVMNKEKSFNQQQLRSHAMEDLPEYMIPTFFVEIDEIPVTPVGKIDRKRLPQPAVSVSKEKTVPPRNDVETKLVDVWEKLLGFQPIGIKDHYFELGGNSLMAMQMFSEIEKLFHVDLPVSLIFQEDTIEKLASHLKPENKGKQSSSLIPIQPNGPNLPIFCVHGGGGEVLVYGELARELGNEQPLYGLRFMESENHKADVKQLAEKYIKEIKKVQPRGPYILFGYCFGGVIAYEMGQQLRQANQEVPLVTILNFANPVQKTVENQYQISYKQVVLKNIKLLLKMPVKQRISFFSHKVKNAVKLLKSKPAAETNISELFKTRAVLTKAVNSYKPKPYRGNLLVIRANNYRNFEKNLGWETTEEGYIFEYEIEAEHITLLKEPHLEVVVKYLNEHLDKLSIEGQKNIKVESFF